MSFGHTFLHRPAQFPPAGGDSWGDCDLVLRLPGGACELRGLATGQRQALAERFPTPAVPSATAGPPLVVTVRRADAAAFRALDTRGWEYTLDFEFAAAGLRLVGLGLAAEVDWRGAGTATLWLARGERGHLLGDVENLLRVVTAYRLLAAGGAMIHCAALAERGLAVLAVGRSGAGKSTLSRQAAASGAQVISDDLAAVRPEGGALWIEPLPFGGDFGPPAAALAPLPLAAILRLEQAPADQLVAISRAETVALLLACAPVVNQDPFRREELFGVLSALVATGAPRCHALRFTPTPASWRLVRNTLLGLTAGATP